MGRPSVGKMLREEMTSADFAMWEAYYAVEPWGEERADLRAGIIASTQANCHRTKGAAFKPSDFMPQFDKPKQSPQQVRSVIEMGFRMMMGKKRGGNTRR